MRKAISAVMIILALAGFAEAQNLGSKLSKVGAQYAQAYLAPAANAFGMDLNSGLFHSASVGGILPFGLHLYIGVQMSGTLLQSSDKSFNLTYHDTYSDPLLGNQPATYTVTNAPTIFGSKTKGTVVITPDNRLLPSQTDTTIGGVGNISIAPIPIPQLGLGSVFGTDVVVRYLPKIKLSDYGSVQLFGFAVRHNISQYIPLVPVDIAVQLGWQNFSVSDTSSKVLNASAFAANLEVSKTFAIVTLYGGLQVESSSFDVNYNFMPPATSATPNPKAVPISFTQKGKNTFRGLVGLSFGLGVLTINADYSIGSMSAVTAGVGLSI
ncbi:MAG: hypothetical protein M1339_06035 [Bacteroidetes bacterium]|nr:hypothetical protein [Bacteroidota bacterium]